MAKLVLTESEKKAVTWLELDDETIGKVVKIGITHLKHISDEKEQLFFYTAAMIICGAAAEANADKFVQTIEGLTLRGNPVGDWEITVKRVK